MMANTTSTTNAVNAADVDRGNHPACAACRFQRRKCASGCVLRRHFPADRTDDFKAVHKTFGVANVTRMMREADSAVEQDEIAKSLLWESDAWARDPTRGPYASFLALQDEVRVLREHVTRQQMLIHNVSNGYHQYHHHYGSYEGNMGNSGGGDVVVNQRWLPPPQLLVAAPVRVVSNQHVMMGDISHQVRVSGDFDDQIRATRVVGSDEAVNDHDRYVDLADDYFQQHDHNGRAGL